MILHLDKHTPQELIEKTVVDFDARFFCKEKYIALVTSSAIKNIPHYLAPYTLQDWVFDDDIQLSSSQYKPSRHTITLGKNAIGGDSGNMIIMAGPCAVESYEQMDACCHYLKTEGINVLRAGCFKPRTSPYTFQGLGEKGLEIMVEMRKKYDMAIVTEARDASNVDIVIENADIVQIGTKSMFDYALLAACGDCNKPILLKRNYGATLREYLQSAEFIMSRGNENVILCERGIRSFEHNTRYTLDLCGVAWLKEHTSLPIIVDPSHAMGIAYGIPDLARAATAMGIDGLLIETHPNPEIARSDSRQQLAPEAFSAMIKSIKRVAKAIDRHVV